MAWGFNSRQDDFLNEMRSMFEQVIANANMTRVSEVETSMQSHSEEIQERENELIDRERVLEQKQEELMQMQLDLEHKQQELETRNAQLKEKEQALAVISESQVASEGDWSKFYHLLEGMKQDVAEIVRRDELMKSLHAELQQHNRNLHAEIIKPLLLHLVNVHKRMLETYQHYCKLSVEENSDIYKKLLEAINNNILLIRDTLEEEYDWCYFEPKEGDDYSPKEYNALRTVETDDPQKVGKVAICVAGGFREIATGRIIRPAIVSIYKLNK